MKLFKVYLGVLMLLNVACTGNTQQLTFMKSDQHPLLRAARNNDIEKINVLLAQGNLDLETKNTGGKTALLLATEQNHLQAAKLLIEAGANVNTQDQIQDSPFLLAGARGYTEILRLCFEANPDYTVFNRYGGTALIPACERGHVETVKEILLHKDFPIDHVNKLGWTALMEAILLSDGGPKHVQIVQMLVDAGCDVNIPDHDGITPLTLAKSRGYDKITEILQKAGAK
ncbi:ankyrin repeat domain-containing protein [Rapidithrix thailandica]|uniref:Ankyrin repeat domain-containing protein n=1 Tax=Rapidithrix thailandica TaxID=413964 RepID=A0AAW9S8U1_9BACT